MSVDVLQEKIRKMKNPSIATFDACADWIPPKLLEEISDPAEAYFQYAQELLSALKGTIPGVRFGFGSFALGGARWLEILAALTGQAKQKGFYVILDLPELLSPAAADHAIGVLTGDSSTFSYDALLVSSYLGTDVLKPFLPLCRKGTAVFAVARTANKSASEIQDLLTGSRLVHTAIADIVSRNGEVCFGRNGYSQLGVLASASASDSLRSLRGKYKRLFLLLDGYDYPNANAKNCGFAFDQLGHGAAVCAGSSLLAAWKESEGEDYLSMTLAAAERMKRNLTRYVSIL